MRTFIASVDMDCDGPRTYVYRLDLPAGLEDTDACKKAVELGQMPAQQDPSEWFTIRENSEAWHRAISLFLSNKSPRETYVSTNGNIFR